VLVVGRRLLARAATALTDAPVQTALLPDGMQVQILMPPLSPGGPLLSVRCPGKSPIVADGLVTEGMLSLDMLALLRSAVQRRLNVLVAGPLASGVSTLIAALGSMCPDHERLVTLLDGPALTIEHPHVLPLQRSASAESLADILRHAARLRPDRILIDDVHGLDALPLLVFASASRGLVAGMHAPSSEAALQQLEMFAQVGLAGSATLGPLLSQAFSLLVHVGTDIEGGRRVMGISEVRAARGQTLELLPLYRYDQGFKPSEHRAGFLAN
jgi:pilus assembly protein CpaF